VAAVVIREAEGTCRTVVVAQRERATIPIDFEAFDWWSCEGECTRPGASRAQLAPTSSAQSRSEVDALRIMNAVTVRSRRAAALLNARAGVAI
jgi:hypothetical protein